MEMLIKALHPIRCLETNLNAAWTNRYKELPKEKRSTAVLDFLIATIKPCLLLVHGRPAIRYIETITGTPLALNTFHKVQINDFSLHVYPRLHLSFQLSKAECRSIGDKLREYVMTIETN